MTEYDCNAVKKLRRDIAAVLHGHGQPIVGTALVIATADWLRQYHPPDVTELQLDELRIQILMRFLKGVAEKVGLGMEVEMLDDDDEIRFDA